MDQRSVIVTGAFGALGAAIADRFAAAGDRVVRVDFAPAPADGGALAIGGVDLADHEAARGALEQAVDRAGLPLVLVNVAGGFAWRTLEDGGAAEWERMFRMNALTAATMCALIAPLLRPQRGAAIINVGAAAADRAEAGMGAYTASKAAVIKLTESLAAELARSDVTVNAVLPTIIDTPANRADMPDADPSAWVQPTQIAEVVHFLASPASRCISGASIRLSRGTPAA